MSVEEADGLWSSPAVTADAATVSSTLHLLLIEDSPSDARLLESQLEEGLLGTGAIEHKRTLSAGLERLAQGGIDAVLLDLGLPDSSGIDTFRRVADAASGAPVVVVTGLSDTRLAEEAVALGAQDYLVKDDATPEGLTRAVTYAVRRQRVLDDLERGRREQLEEQHRFLSHVSHELRTPLATIHQFVSLVADGTAGPLDPEQEDYLGVAMRNVRQLTTMIDDLLTVGRLHSDRLAIRPERTQLADLITDCTAALRPAAEEKRIDLRQELEPLPDVVCDPARMREVLTNLMDNARKFTPDGGTVTLRAGAAADRVRVSVRDSGPGVDPSNAERVFEQFFQESTGDDFGRAGLGLGLFVCRQLVERQGGRIWVETPVDGGATFVFTVPTAESNQQGADR